MKYARLRYCREIRASGENLSAAIFSREKLLRVRYKFLPRGKKSITQNFSLPACATNCIRSLTRARCRIMYENIKFFLAKKRDIIEINVNKIRSLNFIYFSSPDRTFFNRYPRLS